MSEVPKDPVEKHTHVVITFTQGGQLRFVDPRTFGELFITFGVLMLRLHATSYDWEFVRAAGGDFEDAGSADCTDA